jgi:hypothetical protein
VCREGVRDVRVGPEWAMLIVVLSVALDARRIVRVLRMSELNRLDNIDSDAICCFECKMCYGGVGDV